MENDSHSSVWIISNHQYCMPANPITTTLLVLEDGKWSAFHEKLSAKYP